MNLNYCRNNKIFYLEDFFPDVPILHDILIDGQSADDIAFFLS